VSTALAGEDGVTEFYAGCDPLPPKASDFVRAHVYPLGRARFTVPPAVAVQLAGKPTNSKGAPSIVIATG
jgi:hypothetical protein